jgi:exosortase A
VSEEPLSLGTIIAGDRSTGSAWRRMLTFLACLVFGILVIFHGNVASAVTVWLISPTFNHCLLILPTALYLVWQNRVALEGLRPSWQPRAVPLFLPLALLWLFGQVVGIIEIEQVAVVGMIEVALLAALGWRVYRAILFPALFLFFLVPTGEYLIGPLQRFTTSFIGVGLDLFGIPAYIEGTLIELANGSFQVAEACAGLRFLIATIVIGVLFAHLYYTKPFKIILFLIACAVVPVIANGLRALGIVLLAHATDNRVAAGADHIIYGWGFSVAILFLLLFVGARFGDPPRSSAPVTGGDRVGAAPGPWPLSVAAVAALILIASGPALAWRHDQRPISVDVAALSLPSSLGPFRVEPGESDWRPLFLEPDARVTAALIGESHDQVAPQPVDFDLFYYARMRKSHELVSSSNRLWSEDGAWRQISDGRETVAIGGVPIEVRANIMSSVAGKRLVWSWYWMDGHFTTSKPLLKLLQLKTAFARCQGGALITLSTPIEGAAAAANDRLAAAARALDTLPGRLAAACGPGSAG